MMSDSDLASRIVDLLQVDSSEITPGRSYAFLKDVLDVNPSELRVTLRRLTAEGLIEREGSLYYAASGGEIHIS